MFGHFIEEGISLKTVEVEDGEGIYPVFDRRSEEDPFVAHKCQTPCNFKI